MRAALLGFTVCLMPALCGAQTAAAPAKTAPAKTAPATTAPATAAPSTTATPAPVPAPPPVAPAAGAPTPAGSAAEAPVAAATAVLASPGFPYKPEGRRDPFVSLLRRGNGVATTSRSDRPAGLAGLDIAETTLKGILASEGGFVAMLQGADQRTYIVRTGEGLMNGAIRSITKDSVVFLQKVEDPLSREKQREVRKVLRQTEEAK